MGINWGFARQVGLPKWAWRTARRQVDKRVLRRDSAVVLPTGLPIALSRHSPSAGEVFVTGADIDWGAEALFARFADPASDLFDVGAHVGYYSLYLAPLVRRVWAFEPDVRNTPALLANLRRAGNAEHVAAAVSSTSGIVRFATGGSSAMSHVAAAGEAIAAVSLDDFVREADARPALIKIDVEGHDLAVLDGARKVLTRHQPLVLTEFEQGVGDNDAGRLMRLLTQAGYAAFAPMVSRGGWRPAERRLVVADAALLASGKVKMVFLVPERLQRDFAAIVSSGERL